MIDTTAEIKKHLGNTIRTRRQMFRLTIEEFSELIDISPSFLGLIERGKRGLSLPKLLKASVLLHCSMDELTGATEYLKISNNDNIYANCLAEHAKAYQCQNDEDITFLVGVMKYMNEYKNNLKYKGN